MEVNINPIEKGTMNWHVPMNANLEAIKQAFVDLDAQAGQMEITTTMAAFYALTKAELSALYTKGTRRIHALSTAAFEGGMGPVDSFLIHADGSYYLTGCIAPRNCVYEGKDLSTVFESAAQMHAAVANGDFSRIRVGDYWPIELNGSYTDYGDGTTKSLAGAKMKLEVAAIDFYHNHGDLGVTDHHLVMCSRDCLPNTIKWRSANTTWTDAGETNPWRGSAIYATLNNGILPLVAATDIGAYIYAGHNDGGMRFMGESKAPNAINATSFAWSDRGKLFLPTEGEVWGRSIGENRVYTASGSALQWPIFAGSYRHVIKCLGDAGTRINWWLATSGDGYADYICFVGGQGVPHISFASDALGVPLCFLFA